MVTATPALTRAHRWPVRAPVIVATPPTSSAAAATTRWSWRRATCSCWDPQVRYPPLLRPYLFTTCCALRLCRDTLVLNLGPCKSLGTSSQSLMCIHQSMSCMRCWCLSLLSIKRRERGPTLNLGISVEHVLLSFYPASHHRPIHYEAS